MNSLLRVHPGSYHAGTSWQQTRHIASIPVYSETLGNYQVRRLRRWTADEIGIVKLALKDGKSWRDLTELLPTRTPRTIKNQYDYHRYASMTPHTSTNLEVQALLDFASKGVTRDEIQREFSHLSRGTINQRLMSRGLKPSPTVKTTYKRWSSSEDDFVKQGLKKRQTAGELAKDLPGRTTNSISVRMYRLASTAEDVAPASQAWSEQDDTLLLSRLASGKHTRDVAKEIGRSYNATHSRLQTLRLRQKKEADRSVGKT
jgi:hypothetical protein